jgi:hypothetical protein
MSMTLAPRGLKDVVARIDEHDEVSERAISPELSALECERSERAS